MNDALRDLAEALAADQAVSEATRDAARRLIEAADQEDKSMYGATGG